MTKKKRKFPPLGSLLQASRLGADLANQKCAFDEAEEFRWLKDIKSELAVATRYVDERLTQLGESS